MGDSRLMSDAHLYSILHARNECVHKRPDQGSAYHRIVNGHTRHFRRPVFLNKRPGMVMRIRWLAAGLPNAKIIHMLRDGRAVANSILVQCKRRGKPHWSYVGKEKWPELAEMDSASYSGAIWSRVSLMVDRALADLGPERTLTIRYEDYVAEPHRVLEETAAFCGVPFGPEHHDLVPELIDQNYKWREQMTTEEQELMLAQVQEGLEHFGYE